MSKAKCPYMKEIWIFWIDFPISKFWVFVVFRGLTGSTFVLLGNLILSKIAIFPFWLKILSQISGLKFVQQILYNSMTTIFCSILGSLITMKPSERFKQHQGLKKSFLVVEYRGYSKDSDCHAYCLNHKSWSPQKLAPAGGVFWSNLMHFILRICTLVLF
jgi:hypothetical protein